MNWLLVVVGVAIGAGLFLLQRVARDKAAQGSFEAQVFETPAGTVAGRDLRVVKRARMGITPNNVEGMAETSDEFWYCVGPGPTYWLAIPTIGMQYGSVAYVRWVVRPLSAERMRAALMDDRRALKLAFGEAVEA